MNTASQNQIVLDQYDTQSAAYLNSLVHAQGPDLALMRELASGHHNSTALDMGCGGGHVTYSMAPLVKKIVAYDLSPAMVNTVAGEAQRRGLTNVVTTCGSAEDLPFPPETFDLVMSRYSAHHWHDVDGGIAQMSRVLRPGGLALFSDVISPEVALFDTWLQTFELLRDPSHVRDLQQSEWVDLLDAKGFVITRMERLRLRLDFASWTARMRTRSPVDRDPHAARRRVQGRARLL